MNGSPNIIVRDLLRPIPGKVICDGCDATTEDPPVGDPPGWDSVFRTGIGFIFTCPACLDRAEAIFRGGGSYLEARRSLGDRP